MGGGLCVSVHVEAFPGLDFLDESTTCLLPGAYIALQTRGCRAQALSYIGSLQFFGKAQELEEKGHRDDLKPL